MKLILFVLAAILFGLEAFRVPAPFVAWQPAAFCCLTVGLLII